MTSVLARYLTDFGGGDARRGSAPQAAPPHEPRVETPPPIDLEAVRREAYRDGRQAAEAELRAAQQAALSELAARHEDELATLTSRYQAELADAIARRFDAMRAELGREIGRQAAEVLAPFVEHAVAQGMVQRLADAIAEALGDSAGTTVTVHGPAYLFGYLQGLPALRSVTLVHVETDDVDLATEIDGTVLRTRISALAASLSEGGP